MYETFLLSFKHAYLQGARGLTDEDRQFLETSVSAELVWISGHPAAQEDLTEKRRSAFDIKTRAIQKRYYIPGDAMACPCGWRLPAWRPGWARRIVHARLQQSVIGGLASTSARGCRLGVQRGKQLEGLAGLPRERVPTELRWKS
jgi:hypothetical protein